MHEKGVEGFEITIELNWSTELEAKIVLGIQIMVQRRFIYIVQSSHSFISPKEQLPLFRIGHLWSPPLLIRCPWLFAFWSRFASY